jgi:hypothetical protein
VERMARKLQLPYHVRHATQPWSSTGLQAAARRWRRDEATALLHALDGQVTGTPRVGVERMRRLTREPS